MAESLTGQFAQLDREMRGMLRSVDSEKLDRSEREVIMKLKTALSEIRLDIRDYEYAQTRAEQTKWSKHGRHNLRALNALVLMLAQVFGPADVASIGARIDSLQNGLQ